MAHGRLEALVVYKEEEERLHKFDIGQRDQLITFSQSVVAASIALYPSLIEYFNRFATGTDRHHASHSGCRRRYPGLHHCGEAHPGPPDRCSVFRL